MSSSLLGSFSSFLMSSRERKSPSQQPPFSDTGSSAFLYASSRVLRPCGGGEIRTKKSQHTHTHTKKNENDSVCEKKKKSASVCSLTLKPVFRSSLRKRNALDPLQNWETSPQPSTSSAALFINVFFATTSEASSGMSPLSFSRSGTETPLKVNPTTAVLVSSSDLSLVTTSVFLSLVRARATWLGWCLAPRDGRAQGPVLLDMAPTPPHDLFAPSALLIVPSISLSLSLSLVRRVRVGGLLLRSPQLYSAF
mmetsp:Transcript_9885/g.35244  ORF Transcript_9885/g.35244 Transcript_9885/m.35244 type:complete len:252 (-) Transcript_9885:2-757(-)